MRKFYCRRLCLPLFILSILSTFFLVFNTIIHNGQENIASFIYNTQTNCVDSSRISSTNTFNVPANYLVIPYKEYVMRTSIICKGFRLDNFKEESQNFYPKYSKYLRGSFPYVIPTENITFDDIENFYTKTLVNKPKTSSTIDTPFAKNITFENIPYKFYDGMWHPIGVTSAQRTALLVPLQGREYNAKAFLLNMHAFLRRQQLTYTILLVEQVSPLGQRFNKGRLFNTAVRYLQNQSLNITCLILHDVDLLPEDDGNFYICESRHPKHTTSRVRQLNSSRGYTRHYEFLIGGVLILTYDMYVNLNGFSNLYWGWGGEDDDLALRIIQQRMCIVRPSYELAIYIGLPHPRGKRNNARFGLLTWSTLRLGTDGYAQIEPLTKIVEIHQTSIVTHLKLDVNININVSNSTSTGQSLTSLNRNNNYLSSKNKLSQKTLIVKSS